MHPIILWVINSYISIILDDIEKSIAYELYLEIILICDEWSWLISNHSLILFNSLFYNTLLARLASPIAINYSLIQIYLIVTISMTSQALQIEKCLFPPHALDGSNYMTWMVHVEGHLTAKDILHTISDHFNDAENSNVRKEGAEAFIFILHHRDVSLLN